MDTSDASDEPSKKVSSQDNSLPKPPLMKFYCTGFDRKNEEGERYCTYRARKPWPGYCPGCGRPYECKSIKRGDNNTAASTTLDSLQNMKVEVFFTTYLPWFDSVLGGGLVLGSVVMLGGKRGTGKSTLLLQTLEGVTLGGNKTALYVSGENTSNDLARISQRLKLKSKRVHVLDMRSGGVNVDKIIEKVEEVKAKVIVIDSVQAMMFDDVKGDAGSPSQVKALANFIPEYAKEKNVTFILVSQMNAAGDFSGTTQLQHFVDVLVFFDNLEEEMGRGQIIPATKGMRSLFIDGKNRLGESTEDRVILEMTGEHGLQLPSEERLKEYEAGFDFDDEPEPEPEPEPVRPRRRLRSVRD